MMFTRLIPVAVVVVAAAGLGAPAALAAEGRNVPFTLFGDAERTTGGAVALRSDSDPGFGGVDFKFNRPVALADIAVLQTAFDPTDDTCGGGSPRFQLNIDTDGDGDRDGNVFVYLGTPPGFSCTAAGDSGNLVGSTEPRFDSTQLGGPGNGTWATTAAVVDDGRLTGVQLVVDGSFTQADGEQTIVVNPAVRLADRS